MRKYGKYESETYRRMVDAAWRLQAHAVALKRYVKDSPPAYNALSEIERLAGLMSEAVGRDDYDTVKRLAEKAAEWRSRLVRVKQAPAEEPERSAYLEHYDAISEAIREFGGY